LVETKEIPDRISRVQLLSNYQSPLFPFLNAQYVLAKKVDKRGIFSPQGNSPEMFKDARYELAFEDKSVQVYHDLASLPRVWSVNKIVFYEDEEDLVAKMVSADFDPSRMAVIEEGELKENVVNNLGESKIRFLEYLPNREKIEISMDKPGLLIESASHYPGWRAYLDGEEVKVIKANYSLRAYMVPRGRHILEVVYEPKSFRRGSIITILSLFALFSSCLVVSRLKRG